MLSIYADAMMIATKVHPFPQGPDYRLLHPEPRRKPVSETRVPRKWFWQF
jgi:hypothetical protein